MPEALYYNEARCHLYIKAVGHITAAFCGDLRETIYKRLQTSPLPEELIVDLSDCDYMDSTFMGLLVGLNKRCLVTIKRKMTILSPSTECYKLLTNLGVMGLLNFSHHHDFPDINDMTRIAQKSNPTTEILLNAHENLMELSVENQKKFSTLQGLLKKQMEEERKKR